MSKQAVKTTLAAADYKPAAPTFDADRVAAEFAERERVLTTTLRHVDAHSQRMFGAIESVARVALLSLDTPDGHCTPEDLAVVLRTLMNLAAEAPSEINAQVANAGCGFVDNAARRRIKALADREGRPAQF